MDMVCLPSAERSSYKRLSPLKERNRESNPKRLVTSICEGTKGIDRKKKSIHKRI